MTVADGNVTSIANYAQDVAYASSALQQFVDALQKIPRRTLVVFWGIICQEFIQMRSSKPMQAPSSMRRNF